MAHLYLRRSLVGTADQDIRAVLFDKDGTLAVSEPILQTLAEARVFHCQQLLSHHHPELPETAKADLHQLLQRAYGIDAEGVHPAGTTAVASRQHNLISTATALAQIGLGWPEALDLSERVFSHTDHLHHGPNTPVAQATAGLHKLVGRLTSLGILCAVISNDELAGIEAFLTKQRLDRHFQACWSAEHTPCKPDPRAVHALCEHLGIEPSQCALIGDANSDLRMARAAGISVVLGYTAAWSRCPSLDPSFPHVHHWDELDAQPAALPAAPKKPTTDLGK